MKCFLCKQKFEDGDTAMLLPLFRAKVHEFIPNLTDTAMDAIHPDNTWVHPEHLITAEWWFGVPTKEVLAGIKSE